MYEIEQRQMLNSAPGQCNPECTYRLGDKNLECNSAERDLGFGCLLECSVDVHRLYTGFIYCPPIEQCLKLDAIDTSVACLRNNRKLKRCSVSLWESPC